VRVLRAAGGELERDFAFGAVRQMFEPVLTAAAPDEHEHLLHGSAVAAAVLIDPVGERVEAGFPLLHALYWLLANLAAGGPLLLAIDDLQWVDDSSLRALDYLAQRLGDLPVALVAALRPAEPGAHNELLGALGRRAVTIMPAALSAEAVAEVVRVARPGVAGEVCAAYHAASSGNPFYLSELLRAVGDADAATIRAASVPQVGDRVVRRIRRVAPEAPALAAALAVLGDAQPLARVVSLAELDPGRGAEIARELARIDVLAGNDPASFAHPVIRHSVYEALSGARRASLHAAAAELLEAADAPADAVAGHLMALPPAGASSVAVRLVAAAGDALSRGATATAIRRLRRALAEDAPEPPRAELLFELGRAEGAARDPACFEHLQAAFAASDTSARVEVALVLSELLASSGQWNAAWSVVESTGADTAHPLYLDLLAVRAVMMANDRARVHEFYAQWDRWSELARGDRWANRAIAALLSSQATTRGDPLELALAHAHHAMADGVLLAEYYGGGYATMQVTLGLIACDALDEAEAWGNAILAAGRRTGSVLATVSGMATEAWAVARRGDLVAAEARVRDLAEIAFETGMAMWVTSFAHLYQDVLAERPSVDDVVEAVFAAEPPAEFMASRGGTLLHDARGRIALGRGELERARTSLSAAAADYGAMGVGPAASNWRSQLAMALAPVDHATARTLADEEVRIARAAGYPRALGVALRAAGLLRTDAVLLRESLAVLAGTHAALERAYTHLELGVVLRRSQQIAAARDHLGAAVDLAHRCGADRLLARAMDELRAAGARPRRIARTGRDALTPRELRVAELAAGGRTNAEIAQELYLSMKTVETHLTNIYGKLGLSGRGARGVLPTALAA
jgi:DNA-binding CsgD family transcriptional regulator